MLDHLEKGAKVGKLLKEKSSNDPSDNRSLDFLGISYTTCLDVNIAAHSELKCFWANSARVVVLG